MRVQLTFLVCLLLLLAILATLDSYIPEPEPLCKITITRDTYSIACPESEKIKFCQQVGGENKCKILEKSK